MKTCTLLICFFISTTSLFSQATYTVDNKPGAPADFDNLQTAINTAAPGDILLVQGSPDAYVCNGAPNCEGSRFVINKEIHIVGTGYFLDQNPNTQAFQTSSQLYPTRFVQGAEGSTISGVLFVTGNPNVDIQTCNNISLTHCRFSGSNGIYITNSHNIFVGYSYLARIYVQDNISSNLTLKGSFSSWFINGNPSTFSVINCDDTTLRAGMTAYNNIITTTAISNDPNIHHNVFTGGNAANNGIFNNIFQVDYSSLYIESNDPRYSSDGRYILKAGSPAIGAGVGGIDCGIFGGGYRLSGIPNIPNIYEFEVPETGYTNESGINIQVKATSNN